jgi:hypothetical protein
MKTTERKYWENGIQKRHNFMWHKIGDGKYFWTLAFSVFGLFGVLISGRPLEIDVVKFT